ncbi:bile acid:sodium symporter family protein [Proteiniphilum sp.]|uniref:bile acid:sodium symporter family protein n=1 Tax=Proteiniphilum sp. TaxID=1926877 RepID=UPI00332281F0
MSTNIVKNIFKVLLYLGIVNLFFAILIYSFQLPFSAALIAVIGLVCIAISFNGFERLKGFAYTVWILVAITLGMCFPSHFITWGDFELKRVIIPFTQITMLGMGAQMSFDDFKGVVKMPKGVLIGLICHFTVMPLIGYTLSKTFHFPPEIAAGVVLIGCVPSAMASNVMSFLAKANLALSVTVGAIGTMLAPFLTPLLMQWLGGAYVEINVLKMMMEIINMIIFPIIAGFIFNMFYHRNATPKAMKVQLSAFALIIIITIIVLHFSMKNPVETSLKTFGNIMFWFYLLPMVITLILRNIRKITKQHISNALGFIAMMGIVINTVVITSAGRDNFIQVGWLLVLSCLLHNVIGYTIGYSTATLFRLPIPDRRTIAFEVGMQNGGVATGLALEIGKIATVGLASAIFGPLQNLTGSALVNIFKRRPID